MLPFFPAMNSKRFTYFLHDATQGHRDTLREMLCYHAHVLNQFVNVIAAELWPCKVGDSGGGHCCGLSKQKLEGGVTLRTTHHKNESVGSQCLMSTGPKALLVPADQESFSNYALNFFVL